MLAALLAAFENHLESDIEEEQTTGDAERRDGDAEQGQDRNAEQGEDGQHQEADQAGDREFRDRLAREVTQQPLKVVPDALHLRSRDLVLGELVFLRRDIFSDTVGE